MDTAVTSLLAEVHTFGNQLSASQDAKTRSKLRTAVARLSLALEEPGDVLERITMQVKIVWSYIFLRGQTYSFFSFWKSFPFGSR